MRASLTALTVRRLVEGARRAKQQNPRLRRKRLPKPLFPGAAERRYRRYLEALAVRLAELVRERLLPALPRLAARVAEVRPDSADWRPYRFSYELPHGMTASEWRDAVERATREVARFAADVREAVGDVDVQLPEGFRDGLARVAASAPRLDAWADEIEAILDGIRRDIDAEFGDPDDVARSVARDVSEWNGAQLQKTIRAAFNTEVAIPEPWIADAFSSFAAEQVKLIRSVPEQFLTDVGGILQRGFRAGTPHEQLARDIRDRFDVPKNKAATLARTSVAQLNSTLTRLRNQEMGVTHYVWRTALDDRVRPSHMAKEGERYAWNDPPKDTGHPGMDFNCRCVAEPDVSALIEATEQPAA